MPRPTSQTFLCDPLRDLSQQLLYASEDVRREHVRRAEKLHDEIGPEAVLSLEFIKYRVTGYRDEGASDTVFTGQALLPDLRLMIDKVSRSAPLPVTDDEPVERPAELARRLGVSEKTIGRWRKAGLRWRWVTFPGDPRKKMAICRAASDAFAAAQAGRVDRASRFSQIDDDAKSRIIERARRLAQAVDATPFRIASHLSRRVGRAPETVRLMLEQYDREHPQSPIFAARTHPLTTEEKRQIAHAHAMGAPTRELMSRFDRTRSTILRAIHEQRAHELRRRDIRFVELPTFARDDAETVLLRPEPLAALEANRSAPPRPASDLPAPLRPLYSRAPLDAAQQRALLVRMNYLKYKAARLRDALDRYEPRVAELDLIDDCLRRAQFIRDEMLAINLPVVLSVARRHLVEFPNEAKRLIALIRVLERCLPVLIEAVESYDIRRDQPIDEFVTWKIMRHLAIENVAALVESAEAARKRRATARSKSGDAMHDLAADAAHRMAEQAAERGVTLPGGAPGAAA